MATGLDTERLRLAFQARPDLVVGIQKAADSPARVALFNSIASFVCDQQQHTHDEPALKRRRVDGETTAANGTHTHANGALPARQAPSIAPAPTGGAAGAAAAAATETLLLEIKDISLSMPQRKKFDLCFTQNYLYARASGNSVPVQGIVYAWNDIEYAFYVPVPDKAQLQYNYIFLPRGQALASLSKPTPSTPSSTDGLPEPLLFTVSAAAPKPGSVGGTWAGRAAAVSDSYSTLLHWALEAQLRAAAHGSVSTQIVGTDAKVFHSMARQAYRPGERAVHVRAFRGSKDGFLFFLPTGILWGFKKPLLFIPLDRVQAVSYTNVLQRTFNVVVEIEVDDGSGSRTEEVEFGMLDQEDYGSIDETYVRRHGLQDRSMAERRKAKRELAENARDGGDGDEDEDGANGVDGDADGANGAGGEAGQQQKTEQQLQDEEDEMEEDYDPGSDGDSDGSGSSDEEEEDDDEDEDEVDEDEDDADEDMKDEGGDEFDVVGKSEE